MKTPQKMLISLFALAAAPLTALAAAVPTTQPTNYLSRFTTLSSIFNFGMNLAIGIGIGISIIFLIVGGIKWTTAGGDKMAAESARKTITNAIIGFVIVAGAIAIRLLVGKLLTDVAIPVTPSF